MRSNRLGFSLIELLVVLGLVGILTIVGYSTLTSSKPSAVKGTLSTLAGHLGQARALARSTGQTIGVRTSGSTQDTLQLEYGVAIMTGGSVTGIQDSTRQGGTFNYVSLSNSTKQACLVDINKALYDSASANPAFPSSILSDLLTPTTPTTTFPTPLFKGGSGNDYSIYFDTVGRPNMDFFVAVVASRGGSSSVDPKGPIGLIVVTRNNGISTYFKLAANNSAESWKRL